MASVSSMSGFFDEMRVASNELSPFGVDSYAMVQQINRVSEVFYRCTNQREAIQAVSILARDLAEITQRSFVELNQTPIFSLVNECLKKTIPHIYPAGPTGLAPQSEGISPPLPGALRRSPSFIMRNVDGQMTPDEMPSDNDVREVRGLINWLEIALKQMGSTSSSIIVYCHVQACLAELRGLLEPFKGSEGSEQSSSTTTTTDAPSASACVPSRSDRAAGIPAAPRLAGTDPQGRPIDILECDFALDSGVDSAADVPKNPVEAPSSDDVREINASIDWLQTALRRMYAIRPPIGGAPLSMTVLSAKEIVIRHVNVCLIQLRKLLDDPDEVEDREQSSSSSSSTTTTTTPSAPAWAPGFPAVPSLTGVSPQAVPMNMGASGFAFDMEALKRAFDLASTQPPACGAAPAATFPTKDPEKENRPPT